MSGVINLPRKVLGDRGGGLNIGSWPLDNYAGAWPAGLNPPLAAIYGAPHYLPSDDGVQRGFPPPGGRDEETVEPWRVRGRLDPRWESFSYRTPFPSATYDKAPHHATPHIPAAQGHYYQFPAPILDTRILHRMPYRVPLAQSRGRPYTYGGEVPVWPEVKGPNPYGW